MKPQTVREAIAWLQTQPPYYTVGDIVVHVEPAPVEPNTAAYHAACLQQQQTQIDLFGWPDHLPPRDPQDRRVLTPAQIKHGERAAARRA